jgi:hypothetical protein
MKGLRPLLTRNVFTTEKSNIMKTVLSLSIALAVAALGQPLYAAGGKHQKAPAAAHGGRQKAPAVAARHRSASPAIAKASKSKRFAHSGAQPKIARTRHRPEAASNLALQRGSSGRANIATQKKLTVNHGRNGRNGRNSAPAVAFGGRSVVNNRTDNRVVVNSPPADVYRNWDHRRTYDWNHHHYHWNDGVWIIIDPSYGYGYYGGVAGYSGGGGSVVSAVQSALDQNGYNAGPVDGVMGPGTRSAIAAFQADHGLLATGQINPPLLHRLGVE